jgi:hypothetical protein
MKFTVVAQGRRRSGKGDWVKLVGVDELTEQVLDYLLTTEQGLGIRVGDELTIETKRVLSWANSDFVRVVGRLVSRRRSLVRQNISEKSVD